MAKQVVKDREISIRLACRIFDISEICYRYQAKNSQENDTIADWLLRLTQAYKTGALDYASCICVMLKAFPGTINEYTVLIGSWN